MFEYYQVGARHYRWTALVPTVSLGTLVGT